MPRGRSKANEPAVTHEKLVRLAKADYGHSAAAAELGVSVGQISSMAWSRALVDAGRFSKVPATSASVRKLRDVEENRWELIAARTGETVGAVKELYGEEAAAASNIRRGRKSETTTSTKSSGSKSTAAKKGAGASASPRRARTRAERAAARANNPS